MILNAFYIHYAHKIKWVHNREYKYVIGHVLMITKQEESSNFYKIFFA